MSIFHLDLRLVTDSAAELRYFFDNPNDYERRELLISDIAELIDIAETDYYVRLPKPAREIGQALYRWLDRDRILTQRLSERPSAVAIATDQRFAHLPWEVLHDGQSFLVQRGVMPIRWTGKKPIVASSAPQNREMNLLFMATSPENVSPILDYESEEARILQTAKHQPLSLVVEESGCLDELRQLVADRADSFDVFHLTGHATVQDGQPRFVTETQIGEAHYASATEIARSLANRVPPMVFLSGCHTGQAGKAGEVKSMAESLLESGALAVLGWGNSVRDTEAAAAAEVLYKTLAEGGTVLQAMGLTYQKLLETGARDWHLLRLYVADRLPESLVTRRNTPGRKRSTIAPVQPQFLNPDETDPKKRIKVPTREEFVGRRRQIQRCLRSLSTTQTDYLGVLIHGMGGLGKSSIASRLCDRLSERVPIVWVGHIDQGSLCHRLKDKLSSELRQVVINPRDELRYRLRDVFEAWSGKPFVFVLDDFEHNLDATAMGYELSATVAAVLKALTWAIVETNAPHRIIITCRYDVESAWIESFYRQPMEAMHGADLEKKCDRLKLTSLGTADLQQEAKQRSGGNPLLLEGLSKRLTEPEPKLEATLEDLKPRVLAQSLATQLEENRSLREMLSWGAVFEIPVPRVAMKIVCGAEFERSLEQSISLGLMEVSPNDEVRVPRILSLMVPAIDEAVYAELAKCLYQQWWEEADTSTEEQQIEIHRFALLGKVEAIAAKIASVLANRWNNSARYREAEAISQATLNITDSYLIWHELARSKHYTDVSQAILCYEQASKKSPTGELDKTDQREKAAINHNLAILKADQGYTAEAIVLYDQLIVLWEQIGDMQSKAATLHQKGILKANQGHTAEAFALYIQSLLLDKQIGNIRGRAATLPMVAQLLAEEGRFEPAIKYLQESIAILKRISSPDAQTVERILAHVVQMQNQA
ncbi:CHAT domain-containing protein [Phormidesmis priestleyi ULC007]|uniref:CHAT domain-containing protein n=1 Tax=Phormidesmis priestleyi ULC007 TaxID=1920490 RepID=A0A2T1DHY3_9CYAN|nr:CHAT domain-containing protein [Phormidesmis priestleyi]PSB20087.1 CHAT domain-containing protein [Phormidesmis priestleyi ULC007]PZO48951.1 MAG: CHAT domain-containing protein [Phormidesmis priestleyi]